MGINFDPKVEQDENRSSNPTEDVKDGGMAGRGLQERQGKEAVGEEVVKKDHVDEMTEHDPDLFIKMGEINSKA